MARSTHATNSFHRWLLVWGLVYPSAFTWYYFVYLAPDPSGSNQSGLNQFVYSAGKVLQFALPAAWLMWVARRHQPNIERSQSSAAGSPAPPASYSVSSTQYGEPKTGREPSNQPIAAPSTAGNYVLGIAFGLIVAAGGVLLARLWLAPEGYFNDAAGRMREKLLTFGIDTPVKYIVLATFYSVCHSGLEEFYWRRFVFAGLKQYVPLVAAILVSSLGFMAHHVIVLAQYFGWTDPATWLMSASVAIGGAFWAWLYHHSGRLGPSWISHLIIDAGIFALGYGLVGFGAS